MLVKVHDVCGGDMPHVTTAGARTAQGRGKGVNTLPPVENSGSRKF